MGHPETPVLEPDPETLADPEFNDVAERVLASRYLLQDENGTVVEMPRQMFWRVANAVGQAERPERRSEVARRFAADMMRLDFLPNSPTLMNAGTDRQQLSACFVLPVEDTLESIFQTLHDTALVQRTGGGTGFSFSRLRQAGAPLAGGGQASGPVGFIRIFDAATANIKQGGKRRGANMGVLHCTHPDIHHFIAAKRRAGEMENFNLSVAVTDEFMQAVDEGSDHPLRDPQAGQTVARIDARSLFDAMVDAAWATGDPGLLFLDAIRRDDPMIDDPPIEATNPCGEVPLRPHEACTLGSINLGRFVQDRKLAVERLRETAADAVRFLDDVVEVNQPPLPAIREATLATRKIGLGVMGFAEMLVRMDIAYDSPAAVEKAREVMALIQEQAMETSEGLADERGVFPHWSNSRYGSADQPIRNATRTAIAPTGTISLIAGTTAGIEPPWALAYRRQNVLEGEDLVEVHPLVEEKLREESAEPSVMEHVRRTGSLAGADVSSRIAGLFVTALQVPVAQHLAIQAAFQAHTDNSVSKTVNLPKGASRDDVAEAYRSAWRLGLKGVTVYRHESKAKGLFDLGAGETPETVENTPRCDPGECEL